MKKNLTLLALFNFLLDFRPYAPLGIIYFARSTGSFLTGMSVFAVTTLTMAVCELPLGIFSDRVGRKRTMILGAAAGAASLLCWALGGHYLVFLGGSAFAGLAGALFSGNNEAFLYDMNGQLIDKVFTEQISKSAPFRFHYKPDDLSAGTYVVHLHLDGKTVSTELLIVQ